jgi:DNA-binding XRE family transcriptional regulator
MEGTDLVFEKTTDPRIYLNALWVVAREYLFAPDPELVQGDPRTCGLLDMGGALALEAHGPVSVAVSNNCFSLSDYCRRYGFCSLELVRALVTDKSKHDGRKKDNFYGFLVKELRLAKKMSIRKLSAEAQVNRVTIRKLEKGEGNPTMYVLERLLSVFNHEIEVIDVEAQTMEGEDVTKTTP